MATLLVFLHGSGSSGRDMRTFFECAPLHCFNHECFETVAQMHRTTILTPTAPKRLYAPCYEHMNVWFNRSSNFDDLGLDDSEDLVGANASLENIRQILAEQESKFERIFVGGFSMGGCLCLHLLRMELPSNVLAELPSRHIPLLMMHGTSDMLIKFDWASQTATSLHLRDVEVQFKSFDGLDHEIGDEELLALVNWMDDLVLQSSSKRAQAASSSSLSSAAPLSGKVDCAPPDEFEYELETREVSNKFKIKYVVPKDSIVLLVARPVMACGGVFEISPCTDSLSSAALEKLGGSGASKASIDHDLYAYISTEATSQDIHNTAREIGKRLMNRLSNQGGSLNPCPMS